MKASVAAFLRIFDVVTLLHQCNIILAEDGGAEHIDILFKGTYHPDSGNIEDAILYGLHSKRYSLSPCLFIYVVQSLEPGGYAFNGVSVMGKGELLVKDTELGLHLHLGTSIKGHKLLHRVGGTMETLQHLLLHLFSQLPLLLLNGFG